MSEIVTYLRGKTLLITGATGFLAKAIVEKILRCAPEVGRIYLVVRARRRKDGTTLSARERVEEEILQSAAFARLRETHGDRFADIMGARVHAVEGDLTLNHLGLEPDLYRRLASEVDVVLTCAASVTFDEEIDAALQLNTLGARRMLDFAMSCGDATLIHVSTAYVNGQTRGRIPETPPRPDWSMAQEMGRSEAPFDLEQETRDILARADEIHDESRSPDQQERFRKMALQQNPSPTQRWLDAQMETFRKRWLKERLIEEGMRRGQQWGWHDSYTLTKAMGEQLIVKHRGDLPTAIIRPSIVESALVDPEPGWIEGLKVADPLIDAVSKGRLPDFPGQKDMIVDIIPVDIVANTTLAAMAHTAREGGIGVYHVSTGDRNPVLFHQAFEHSYEYFQKHPRLNRNNEPIPIQRWTYPTLGQFRRRYNLRYVYPLNAALWTLNRFNRITLLNNLKRRIAVMKSAISRMLYYAAIYSPYTSLECTFETDRTVSLHERLDPEDRLLFNGDVSRIHWKTYFQEIHIPGLKRHVLKADEPKPAVTEEEEVAERSGFARAGEDALPHLDTLTDILAKSADMYGDKTALQMQRDDGWVRYSFKDVFALAGHIGWQWRSSGLHPGDRVLLFSENRPEWGIACFAGMVAGAVLVPVDRRSTPQEVWRIARITESKAILCTENGHALLTASAVPGVDTMFWNIENYGLPFDVPRQPAPRRSASPAALNEEPPPWAPVEPETPAAIMFTRGMAAESHGVVLTHRNFVSNLLSLAEILRAYRTDHFLSLLPLSQALEFTGGFLMPFYAGATITYTTSVRPRSLVGLMDETGVNCLIAAPRIFGLLHGSLRQTAGINGEGVVSRMRLLVSGGGTLDSDLYHAYREIGLTIHEGYGLTEAAPVLTVTPPDGPVPIGSVGKALPGIEIRIVDPDAAGVGEVAAKGPNVMAGYYGNDEATAEALRDGWLYTGDLGRLDKDGHLFLVGRRKDVIVDRGGKNIYPDEVEEIYASPELIAELAVVGLPDGMAEQVAAVVVPKEKTPEGRQQVEAHFRSVSSRLPLHKRIKTVEFSDEALPRTATRKVKRAELVRWLRDRRREAAAESGDEARAGNRILELIASICERPVSEIRTSSSFAELGFDSLMYNELAAGLESEFGESAAPEALANMNTIEELVVAVRTPGADARGRRPRRGESRKKRDDQDEIEVPPAVARAGRQALTEVQRWFYHQVLEPTFTGRAHVPNHTHYLVVANHSSHLDMGLVKMALGDAGSNLVALAAADYFFDNRVKRTFFGNFTNLVPMERRGSLRESLDRAAGYLDQGYSVLVFPEGTRSRSGEIQKFRRGFAHLAYRCRVGVLPIHLDTWGAFPPGAVGLRSRTVAARIGPFLSHDFLLRFAEGGVRTAAREGRVAEFVQTIVERLARQEPIRLEEEAARILESAEPNVGEPRRATASPANDRMPDPAPVG